jgi:hypothetical protein
MQACTNITCLTTAYQLLWSFRIEWNTSIALDALGDSALGTAIRLPAVRSGIRIPEGGRRYFSIPNTRTGSGGTPSLLSNGYRGGFSPGVKRLGHEVEHSLPSSTEIKNKWSYTSKPPICFPGVDWDNSFSPPVRKILGPISMRHPCVRLERMSKATIMKSGQARKLSLRFT